MRGRQATNVSSCQRHLNRFWNSFCCNSMIPHDSTDIVDHSTQQLQVHIPPGPAGNNSGEKFYHIFSFGKFTSLMYTSRLTTVLFFFFVAYIFLVTLFASLLFLLNTFYESRPRTCMEGWNSTESGYDNFEMTFSLSWTTLSSKWISLLLVSIVLYFSFSMVKVIQHHSFISYT